jgi:sugar transferase (PEP-CTERM/EpsH1 system associated)
LILHVIHHLATGGMENGLVNLINGLGDEFRHAIACIEDFSEFRERLSDRRMPVLALHRSRVGVWRLRREIFSLCRRLRPDIVHTRNLSGLDALVPATFAGVPIRVHGEHGWDVGDLFGKNVRTTWLRRFHAPFVSQYIAVSDDIARYLTGRIGISPERVLHICNGVDTNRFAPAFSKPYELLPPALQGERLFVVGAVGRAQPVKDQETLLRAFAELLRMRPELRSRARLVVVGDGPLLGELQALTVSLGIDGSCWLPGARCDVAALYNLFDVSVLPSLNEGISNTILEAMASGVPVVATAVGGNTEIVRDGHTGALFPPRDVAYLAQILAAYADDPALPPAHGLAARHAAVEQFGLAEMIDRYRATYRSLLAPAADGERPFALPRGGSVPARDD